MKTSKILLSFALLGVCLSTTAAFANPRISPCTGDFVTKASASNAFEITSSKLALKKSHNPQIRAFAQKMIADHMKAGAKLKAVLASDHLPPPPAGYNDKQISMLNHLHDASDGYFDSLYVSDQQKAHMEAVHLFWKYATKGDNADLKKFAATTLPVLKQHKQMIDSME